MAGDKKPSIWPFFLIPIVFLLNVEVPVPNALLHWHLVHSYRQLATIDIILGISGIFFWYHLVGHFWKFAEHSRLVESSVSFFGKKYEYLTSIGFIRNVVRWFQGMSTENATNRHFINGMERLGLVVRYIAVFILPFNIIPYLTAFTWFPAVIFCRASNWRKGLIVMMVGDAIKNALVSNFWWHMYH